MDSFLFPFWDYHKAILRIWEWNIEDTLDKHQDFRWKLNWSWQYFLLRKNVEARFTLDQQEDKWIVKFYNTLVYPQPEKEYKRLRDFYIDLFKFCDELIGHCELIQHYWDSEDVKRTIRDNSDAGSLPVTENFTRG